MRRAGGRSSRSPALWRLGVAASAIAVWLAVGLPQLAAGPQIGRFISLTASPNPLDLGAISQPGAFDSSAVLTAHFVANCSHGNLVVSCGDLVSATGSVIPADRLYLRLPDTGNYVPMTAAVQVALPAGPAVLDLALRFRVQTLGSEPAGTYTGTLQTRVVGGPDGPDVAGPSIPVSVAIETYCSYSISGNKCYVHLGQPFQATADVLTLRPAGTLATSAGMYIGLDLSGVGTPGHEPVERDTLGRPTGRIVGAMAGTKDVLGRSIAGESFDARALLSCNGGGTFNPPDSFGASPDGSVSRSLWWLVGGGAPGQYPMVWDIRLLPEAAQADGNYSFEAAIVVAPQL
ncbi:MAG: hypothetical protein BIFFINMI_00865 [Phycisphaerae bacterium]|nr:hypothetical protein [Phycisphaerae bacterium]